MEDSTQILWPCWTSSPSTPPWCRPTTTASQPASEEFSILESESGNIWDNEGETPTNLLVLCICIVGIVVSSLGAWINIFRRQTWLLSLPKTSSTFLPAASSLWSIQCGRGYLGRCWSRSWTRGRWWSAQWRSGRMMRRSRKFSTRDSSGSNWLLMLPTDIRLLISLEEWPVSRY